MAAHHTPSDRPTGRDLMEINLFNYPFVTRGMIEGLARAIYSGRWREHYRSGQTFTIEDNPEYWRVYATPMDEEYGNFCALIDKFNGRIINAGVYLGPGGIPD